MPRLFAAAAALAASAAWAQSPAVDPAPAPASFAPADTDLIRVQLRARESTQISAGMSARIEELPYREGDSFAAGALLLGFDCRLEKAELRAAVAEKRSADATVRSYARLNKLQAVSKVEYETAIAKQESGAARIEVNRARLLACEEKAPWAGRIVKLHVARYQRVRQGDPLMDILDPSQLEADLRLPSRWVTKIRIGQKFTVRIDETGETLPATISQIGAQVDPVSQTIPVTGRIEITKGSSVLAGMSGSVQIDFTAAP